MATERDRKKEYDEAYNQAWSGFGNWQSGVKKDLRSYLGDPWTSADKHKLTKQKRDIMSFPLLRRNVKWISGWQSRHRLSLKFDPIENADEQTANQLTAAGLWVMQYGNGYQIISKAFEGALKTGLNLVNVYNDRNSDTKFDRFFYNQFLLDPTFTRIDLEDCHYGILRKHITRQKAKMLLPGKEAFIDNFKEDPSGRDEKFPNYARPTLFGEKLLAYDEFQQRTTQKRKIIIVRPLNQEIVWKGTDAELDRLIGQFMMRGIPSELISIITRWEPTVEVSAYLEGKEVNHSIDPFGIGDFSFTPIICFFDPEEDDMTLKLQSLIHGLIDSQRASDKRILSMVAMFEQQIGVGVDYEEGALVDPEDAFKTGHGAPRLLTEGAISGNRYRDRIVPNIPSGMFQLQNLFDQMIPKMVNINEERIGPVDSKVQIAGILAKLRADSGMIGLSGIFDDLSLSHKMIGQKMLKLIQQYPADKIKRIINEEPSQAFYTREFGKYDCVCTEGTLSDTQRNVFYTELVNLKRLGLELQDPAPISWATLIKYAPIQMKQELIQEMQKLEQQRQQQQARQQKMQDMIQQLAIGKAQAEMAADRGRAEERRAQAVEDTTGAALDRVMTMTKIQELREAPLERLLKIALEYEKIGQVNVEAKQKA